MLAMIEDLQPYPVQAIDRAFLEWRRKSDKVPAPANILKILRENYFSEKENRKRLSDFGGNWKEYSNYLKTSEH